MNKAQTQTIVGSRPEVGGVGKRGPMGGKAEHL